MKRTVWIEGAGGQGWDRFVAAHPLAWVCHRAAWQRAVHESFPHIRCRLAAVVDDGGAILAGLPLCVVSSALLGTRMVSLPFATLSDPLVDNAEDARSLVALADAYRREAGLRQLEVRTYRAWRLMEQTGLAVSRYYRHHHLALDRPPAEIRKTFARTVTRYIGRAERSGLAAAEGTSDADMAAFRDLYDGTRHRLGLPSPPPGFFRRLGAGLIPAGHASLVLARLGGRLVGGVLALRDASLYSMEFLGYRDDLRVDGIVHFLYWEALKAAHAAGCRTFSFGRTSPANRGLMEFKDRWGTTVEDLPAFFSPPERAAGAADAEGSAKYRAIRNLMRAVPLPLYRLLSGFLYRHMG